MDNFIQLGISETTDTIIIKKAFRKKSLEYKNNDKILNSIKKKKINIINKNTDIKIDNINKNTICNSIPTKRIQDIIIYYELTMFEIFSGASVPITINRKVQMGDNITNEKETIYIDIPPGIDDNEIIIIKNKGNYINTLYGNIKIIIKTNNNTPYIRRGLDLYINKNISLKDSLCGFKFKFIFLDNKTYNITNNNIIHPNYNKVIPNMGLKRGNYFGKLIISFNIIFPETISPEAKNIICKYL